MIEVDKNVAQENVEECHPDDIWAEDLIEFVLHQASLESICNLVYLFLVCIAQLTVLEKLSACRTDVTGGV